MTVRVASGVVLGALALALIVLGGTPYALAVIALAGLALFEVYGLAGRIAAAARPWRSAGIAGSILLLGLLSFAPSWRWTAVAALLLLLGSLASLLIGPLEVGWSRWAITVAGLIYVGAPCAALILLRDGSSPSGRAWVLVACAATWGCDTAAFFVGRAVGRRPFFPGISPKKTLEGTIGGILGGSVITVGVAWAAGLSHPLWLIALIGLSGSIAAVLGDLVESAIKRAAGVKDSGTLIPGHGGIMDRIDSLLFVASLVLCWRLVLG